MEQPILNLSEIIEGATKRHQIAFFQNKSPINPADQFIFIIMLSVFVPNAIVLNVVAAKRSIYNSYFGKNMLFPSR